jgi:hypothetical protein
VAAGNGGADAKGAAVESSLRRDTGPDSSPAGRRRPAGLASGPAYFGPLTVCCLAGRAGSPSRLAAEVAVLAVVVAVVSFEAAAPAGLLAVGSSVLSLDGFAEHSFGQLGWEPRVDLPVAAALLLVWAMAWAAREGVPAGGRSQYGPQYSPQYGPQYRLQYPEPYGLGHRIFEEGEE